jgi:hypothetical protein
MITPEAIISYPNIFEAKANLSGALKFSCSLLIDKSDTNGVKQLQDAVAKATIKGKEGLWKGKVPAFRYEPIRDGDKELASGEKTDPIYKNKIFINCTSDEAPGVVDAKGKPLMDQRKLYPGCIVRVDCNAYPYAHKGNSGVGWGLNNVMVVRDGARLDGRVNAEDAFAGFVQPEEPLE